MNSIYKLAKSVLFRFTPEQAHHIILSNLDWATQLGAQKLVTRSFPENPIEIMGLRFPNCVGLAAGMDKDGEHVTAFGALGFGSVEIGTVTPKGQPGNPKPRLFRLIPDEAIINRMGFNNVGAIQVAKNLQSARAFRNRSGILGINIGQAACFFGERVVFNRFSGNGCVRANHAVHAVFNDDVQRVFDAVV